MKRKDQVILKGNIFTGGSGKFAPQHIAFMAKVNPVPKGFQTLTPNLTVRDSIAAIKFYKRVFKATQTVLMRGPDGKSVVHAELRIGNSVIMLNDENPHWNNLSPETLKGSGSSVFVYLPDVDATFKRAVAAGAKPVMPPEDMFWGDRMGKFTDPSGHVWAVATHIKDMTPAQIKKAGAQFFASMKP